MEARLARFMKIEEKRTLALHKADWKRARAIRRLEREYQKWSNDDMSYGDPFEEEIKHQAKEEELAYVGLFVMTVVFLTALFVVLTGIWVTHWK